MDGKNEATQSEQRAQPTGLTGFQRTYLRGLAHHRRPTVQIGLAGITEAVLGAVEQALLAHELIKVRLQKPKDKRAMAAELAGRARAELCGLVGHVAILYRPHPEEPRIVLPSREGGISGEEGQDA